jgi:hypothetical protein
MKTNQYLNTNEQKRRSGKRASNGKPGNKRKHKSANKGTTHENPGVDNSGNNNLPELSLGSWIKDNSDYLIGGLQTAAGAALTATGAGAGVGVPLMASGAGQIAGGISKDQQEKAQEQAIQEQQEQAFIQQKNQELIQETDKYSYNQPLFESGGPLDKLLSKETPFALKSGRIAAGNIKKMRKYDDQGDGMTNPHWRPINRNNLDEYANVYPEEVQNHILNTSSLEELQSVVDEINNQYGINKASSPIMVHEGKIYGNQGHYIKKGDKGNVQKEKFLDLIRNKFQLGGGLPVINEYNGQTHEGPEGGIPVDKNGNPSKVTGNKPVALTEDGEVNFDGYIFSDELDFEE